MKLSIADVIWISVCVLAVVLALVALVLHTVGIHL